MRTRVPRVKLLVVSILLFTTCTGLLAQQATSPADQNAVLTPATLASKLDALLKSKVVTLRVPASASLLKFDEDGQAMERAEPRPWTLYGLIQIEAVEMKHDSTLVLIGKRVFVSFDDSQQQRLLRSDEKLRIEIHFGSAPQMPQTTAAMRKVFLGSGERFATTLPPYWQAFFAQKTKIWESLTLRVRQRHGQTNSYSLAAAYAELGEM